MKFPEDVTRILKNKFKNNHKEWLKNIVSENDSQNKWPIIVNLDIPAEQEALKNIERVRLWISAWRSWHTASAVQVLNKNTNDNSVTSGNYSETSDNLIWTERRWRSLGLQNVPEKLFIANPDYVVVWIGEDTRWSKAVERFIFLTQRWSVQLSNHQLAQRALIDVLPRHFNVLADYNDSDFNNLCEILSWLYKNPDSNLYIRQIPVAGIDSKWLETRKGLVAELLSHIKNYNEPFDNQETENDFFRLCGLKQPPKLIRIRILDSGLRKNFGGLSDITAPLEEIAGSDFVSSLLVSENMNTLSISSLTVFIVENNQTALAFEDMKNSIVIFGSGYSVEVLGKIPWLKQARCIYWGDIDTHGFAILNRIRSYLPMLESILMDEAALFNHKDLWVVEPDQSASADLTNLSVDEKKMYQALKNNTFALNVRLEQERIRWEYAQCLIISKYNNS